MRRSFLGPSSRRLQGLLTISGYTGLLPEQIMDWSKQHRFPARQVRSGYWVTTTSAINRWILDLRKNQIAAGRLSGCNARSDHE